MALVNWGGLGVVVPMILLHRAVLYGSSLPALWHQDAFRLQLLSSVTRDLLLALALTLLLFTFSRRVLKPAVAAFGLREIPDEQRFPIGVRLALLILVPGVFNISGFLSLPAGLPPGRLPWVYLPPVAMTALIGYLVMTDIAADLEAIAGRLRMLAAGVRPDLFHRFAVTGRDEVGELVAAINALQHRVEREFRATRHDRPGPVLAAVNRLLWTSVPPMAFVTVVYAVVDTARRTVTVASGGEAHVPDSDAAGARGPGH